MELLTEAAKILDSKKAENIMAINIENVSVLSRYFLLASGGSITQVSALADELDLKLSEKGVTPLRVEGAQSALWVILDYGEVMVHIFHRDTREFYNLERLWADGSAITAEQLLGSGPEESVASE